MLENVIMSCILCIVSKTEILRASKELSFEVWAKEGVLYVFQRWLSFEFVKAMEGTIPGLLVLSHLCQKMRRKPARR